MHINSLRVFCYIDNFEKTLINKLSKTTSVIYRNYNEKLNIYEIIKIRNACNKRNIKFYLSNDIKLAIKLGLDGAYIPSFNKKMNLNSYNFKKKFELLGSAHNIKEIRLKELQNVDYIFLSPLFPSQKNKRGLGIYRFHNLMKKTKKKIVCLGGLTNKNLKKIKLLKCIGMASISLFHK